MFLALALVLSMAPPTCFALNQEIVDHFKNRDLSNHCSLPGYMSGEHCDGKVHDRVVESKTKCFGYNQIGEETSLLCLDGFWLSGKHTDKLDLANNRGKRSDITEVFDGITGVIGAVGNVLCMFFCDHKDEVKDKPPTIQNCPKVIEFDADMGKTTAKASWEELTCKDDKVNCEITKMTGPEPGSSFKGDRIVTYTATDSAGQKDFCSFELKVNVKTCGPLGYPMYSSRNCTPANFMYEGNTIFGSKCSFSCSEGYDLIGQSTLTCKEDGQFDALPPSCQVSSCSSPGMVKHGSIECPSAHDYKSVCYLQCDPGYEPQHNSPMFIQCKADGTWTSNFPDCFDSQPPEIQCPRSLRVYTERSESFANVTWEMPIVKDNDGALVTVEYSADITNGGKVPVGLYEVRYTATDGNGNTSPCSFFVIVEEIQCRPLHLTDKNIIYDYPNDFGYGQSCSLSCLYRYPLKGPSIITCERDDTTTPPTGYWHWNSTEEPICIENLCSPLDPPLNGALTCSSVGPNKYCKMACNDKFDIPKTINPTRLIVCNNNGEWSPIKEVPDCTEKRNPQSMNLPGEIYYYTGNCSDQTVQNEIKDKFLTFAKEKKEEGWDSFCPKSPCNVHDVDVSCGPSSVRRKRFAGARNNRSAFEIILTYEINMPWVDTENVGMSQNTKFIEELGEVITNASKTGELDVKDLTPSGVTYSFSSIKCPKGQTPRESSESCAGCPSGTFYNEISDDCQLCPKGSYQDQAFELSCKPCPDGTSTEQIGTKNSTSCKDVCPSGYYSMSGVMPCSPCSIGFYQSSAGSSGCIPCPSETTTELVGSKEISACQGFDLVFTSDKVMSFDAIPSKVPMVVTSFWLNAPTVENNTELFSYSDGIVSVNLRNSINFEVNGNVTETAVTVRTSSWMKIVVETDLNSKIATLFVDGKDIAAKNMISVVPGIITIKGSTELKLSSFLQTHAAIRSISTIDHTPSCKSNSSDKFLDMDMFKDLNETAFAFQIPPRCDPIDDCLDSPCGKHKCVDFLGGYTCQCYGGYKGRNCEIAPDHCETNQCSNGALCVNGETNYTCACATGYRGPLCDIAIVNGNWSNWSSWSECTQSCEGGIRYRERYCDNPPPDPYGKQCAGVRNQTEACNQQDCPTCPSTRLLQRYGNVLNCTHRKDQVSCSVTCRGGLVFARGHRPLDRYECGVVTGFRWNAIPPSCSRAKSPEKVDVHTVGGYSNFPCQTVEQAKRQLLENVKDIQCVKNNTCQRQITVTGCSGAQRRKREVSNVHASISLTSKLTGGDNLNLEEFYKSHVVTPELLKYIQTFNDLESSVQEMNMSTPFKFRSQGIDYDAKSVELAAKMTCEPGSIQSEGLCVDCPSGTSQIDDDCDLCEVGTYQNESGCTECKPCPYGYTTKFIGSHYITDCNVIVNLDIPRKTTDAKVSENNDTLIISVYVAAAVVVVIVVTLISFGVCRDRRRRRKYKQTRENNINLDIARPPISDNTIKNRFNYR